MSPPAKVARKEIGEEDGSSSSNILKRTKRKSAPFGLSVDVKSIEYKSENVSETQDDNEN